jgi:hypothetical protein
MASILRGLGLSAPGGSGAGSSRRASCCSRIWATTFSPALWPPTRRRTRFTPPPPCWPRSQRHPARPAARPHGRGWPKRPAFALTGMPLCRTGERQPTGPFVDAMEGALARPCTMAPACWCCATITPKTCCGCPTAGVWRGSACWISRWGRWAAGIRSVSLLQDARRDVSDAARRPRFWPMRAAPGRPRRHRPRLRRAGRAAGLRILGVFARLSPFRKARLCAADPAGLGASAGQPAHPALAPLARGLRPLPAPTPETP